MYSLPNRALLPPHLWSPPQARWHVSRHISKQRFGVFVRALGRTGKLVGTSINSRQISRHHQSLSVRNRKRSRRDAACPKLIARRNEVKITRVRSPFEGKRRLRNGTKHSRHRGKSPRWHSSGGTTPRSDRTDPNQTKTKQTKTNRTEPHQTKQKTAPGQTKPTQTKMDRTKPNQRSVVAGRAGDGVVPKDRASSTRSAF